MLKHTHLLHPVTLGVLETYTAEWEAHSDAEDFSYYAPEYEGMTFPVVNCYMTSLDDRCEYGE